MFFENKAICRTCHELVVEDPDGMWRTLTSEMCLGGELHDL